MADKIEYSKPVPPFVKFCAANIPMVFDDSLSYYEALCALWKWLQTDVIDVINNNAAVTQLWREELTTFENNVTEEIETFETDIRKDFNDLSDLFDQLHDYVENYFDNLDVQEEINNKLDDMVEDGTLQEIITTYIQSNVSWIFDTVADMKLATNLIAGSYARTLGYYAIGDGGGATYKIDDTSTPNEMDIIQIGSSDLSAVLVTSSTKNVKQFGAKGDGIQDDTSFIQRAINTLQDNDCLYLPKGNKSNYLISDTLELTANDVCIYSEPKTEYSTRLICHTSNITMLNVIAYGVTIKNIAFYGDGTDEADGTVDGVYFDRSSLGDADTYANLDEVVEDCLFMYLDSSITFKGRNMRIKNNTFAKIKNGIVGLLHKYSSDTEVSDFRGIWILNNVFHYMNEVEDLTGKTLETLDSCCISTPLESSALGDIQIIGNKNEYCNSIFYKGYLPFAQINDNNLYFSAPFFVYSPCEDPDLTNLSTRNTGQICNNEIRGKSSYGIAEDNFIVMKNNSNIKIANNNFRTCSGDAIVCENCTRTNIIGNTIQAYGTEGETHSGINFKGSGSRATLRDNLIKSAYDNDNGITSVITTNMSGNYIEANTPLNIAGNLIQHVSSATAWDTTAITNSLANSFTLGTDFCRGIRKLEDGSTQIEVTLKNGEDNKVAFVLPSGFRPSAEFALTNITLNPDANTRAFARFYTNGNVLINWGGDTPSSSQSYVIRTIFS